MTKMIIGPFYTYQQIHFTAEIVFVTFVCKYPEESHVTAAAWTCTYYLLT